MPDVGDTLRIGAHGTMPETFLSYSPLQKILERNYRVEFSDDPDYLFCSFFDTQSVYGYCASDAVRIFISGENFTPDFNLMDYGIGFDYLTYGDRFFRMPLWMWYSDLALSLANRAPVPPEILQQKEFFCNFIVGHGSGIGTREDMFERLSKYRRIESVGSYLNNREDGYRVRNYEEKMQFQGQCKFSLAFDSVAEPGFQTEKILHAFCAGTIPIYWGDPLVGNTFNTKAFVNCGDYPDFDAVVERIKEIDQNDELYLDMLNQPVFAQQGYVEKTYADLETFLLNIFSQPLEKAYRRPRQFAPKTFNDDLLYYSKELTRSHWNPFFRTIRYTKEAYRTGGMASVWHQFWEKIKRGGRAVAAAPARLFGRKPKN